jgi:hypothetical protein
VAYIISISITDEEVHEYLMDRSDRSAFIVQLVRDFMGDAKSVQPQETEAMGDISERGLMAEFWMYKRIAEGNKVVLTARDWLMCKENGTLRELMQRISRKEPKGAQ